MDTDHSLPPVRNDILDWLANTQPNLTLYCSLVGKLRPKIDTNINALVLKVMHTKFGQNWPEILRDVENMNFPIYITRYMYMAM